MGASSSVLNRVGQYGGELLVWVPPSASGTIDSGVQMMAAFGYKDWTFQVIGPGAQTAGYSVSCYGSIDQVITVLGRPLDSESITAYKYSTLQQKVTPQGQGYAGSLSLATSWSLLPGPSEQGGTGIMTNPIVTGTNSNQFLRVAMPLAAVRVTVTISGSPSGGIGVLCFATG